ncbi:MAG: YqgE/AlgH family protein [Bacteroidota bacterium]
MVKPELKNGTVLLAEPFMMDPNFKRAAIMLAEHSEEGTIGFILNRPVDMMINELVEDFPEISAPVLYGGPVQTDTLHYLHNVGELLADSREILPGIFWGGDFEQLKLLIEKGLIQPNDIRFYVGYSGWSKGQLIDEMKYGSWVTAPMDANYLFSNKPEQLWSQVMVNKGDVYTVIADIPDGVSYN